MNKDKFGIEDIRLYLDLLESAFGSNLNLNFQLLRT